MPEVAKKSPGFFNPGRDASYYFNGKAPPNSAM